METFECWQLLEMRLSEIIKTRSIKNAKPKIQHIGEIKKHFSLAWAKAAAVQGLGQKIVSLNFGQRI